MNFTRTTIVCSLQLLCRVSGIYGCVVVPNLLCGEGTGTPYWELCGKLQQFGTKGYQAERNRCDRQIFFWAFVFVISTEPIWAPSQLSLCTHTPTAHSTAISRFLCNFFFKQPLIFCQHTIHQVIWPGPGTLSAGEYHFLRPGTYVQEEQKVNFLSIIIQNEQKFLLCIPDLGYKVSELLEFTGRTTGNRLARQKTCDKCGLFSKRIRRI